jgi:hypothetical protein
VNANAKVKLEGRVRHFARAGTVYAHVCACVNKYIYIYMYTNIYINIIVSQEGCQAAFYLLCGPAAVYADTTRAKTNTRRPSVNKCGLRSKI